MPLDIWFAAAIAAGLTGYYLNQKDKGERESTKNLSPPPSEQEDQFPAPPDWSQFVREWFLKNRPTERQVSKDAEIEQDLQAHRSQRRKRWITPNRLTLFFLVGSVLLALLPHLKGLSLGPPQLLYIDLLKTIFFSATVGIGTNNIAIFLLFRPIKKTFGIQGMIPKKKDVIVKSIARGVRNNLLDPQTIKKAIHDSNIINKVSQRFINSVLDKINNPEFRKDLSHQTILQLRALVANPKYQKAILNKVANLARKAPIVLIGRWVPNTLLNWLESQVTRNQDTILEFINNQLENEINKLLDETHLFLKDAPERYRSQREALEDLITQKICLYAIEFDLEKIITEKLENMDDREFHRMINEATENELAVLQYLGALLGAIAGILLFISNLS